MKIDWKAVAQSPGYRSLKAAYTHDTQKAGQHTRPMRDKAEFYSKFQWVIGRAKHYAERQGRSLEDVLNDWEAKRNYWWLNYYQEGQQPKLPSGKSRNVRPQRSDTSIKQSGWLRTTPKERFKRLRQERCRWARFARRQAGKKARWSTEQKARMARIRAYRASQSL